MLNRTSALSARTARSIRVRYSRPNSRAFTEAPRRPSPANAPGSNLGNIAAIFLGAQAFLFVFVTYRINTEPTYISNLESKLPEGVRKYLSYLKFTKNEVIPAKQPAHLPEVIVVPPSNETESHGGQAHEANILEESVALADDKGESDAVAVNSECDIHVASTESMEEPSTAVTESVQEGAVIISVAGPAKAEEVVVRDTSIPAPVASLSLPEVTAELKASRIRNEAANEVLGTLAAQSAAMRRELELTLLSDLEKLDETGLRMRIAQLSAEFFERTKWEGIRLHQSLREIESDITRKYKDLLKEQRSELESELRRLVNKKEEDLAEQARREIHLAQGKNELHTQSMLRAQAEGFTHSLKEELSSQSSKLEAEYRDSLNEEVANLRQSHVKQLLKLQESIAELEGTVAAFREAASEVENHDTFVGGVHTESALLLAFERALEDSSPCRKELDCLRKVSGNGSFVSALLESIPVKAAERGIPTVPELKARFRVVQQEVRKAALAPEGTPVAVANIIGSALAYVTFAPKGNISGEGIEETLARAEYQMEHNRLADALKELSSLSGYPKSLVSDFEKEAKLRIVADQAVAALRAHSAIKHASLSK